MTAKKLTKQERTLTLDGALIMHRSANPRLCDCCGGTPHIHGIEIKLEPQPSAFAGLTDRSVSDFVASWLSLNKLEFEGRTIKVTFEVSETQEEALQRQTDDYIDEEYA